MSDVTVTTAGDREIELRFDAFPEIARKKLRERIESLTDRLQGQSQQEAPRLTGQLRSEIIETMYEGDERIAGYVSVYAPGSAGEYAKAATLEYGSSKARRIFSRGGDKGGPLGRLSKRRTVDRMSKPARIQAFEYLRGPLEAMADVVNAELGAALDEATAEANS